jgi:hypothetical protein
VYLHSLYKKNHDDVERRRRRRRRRRETTTRESPSPSFEESKLHVHVHVSGRPGRRQRLGHERRRVYFQT